jgi:NADPH:quinone reductase
MKALTFSRFGSPEVLEYRELPDPQVGPSEVLVATKAIGMNFADVYRRRGNYHLKGVAPWVLGYEASGVVVSGAMPVGTRVGFADVPHANAELVVAPRAKLIALPDDISFETAAAVLLQGLTAHFLSHDSAQIRPGMQVLVHAAAGGVGLLLIQLAKLRGARVVGLASSPQRRASVLAAGADAAVPTQGDWVAASCAASLTGAYDVVYDSVGSTLDDSLRAARVGGQVVFYGMAGGDPAPVNPRRLMDESKTLTGGDLWNVLVSQEQRERRAADLFGHLRSGALKLSLGGSYALADGARAHQALESRQTVGKLLLLP